MLRARQTAGAIIAELLCGQSTEIVLTVQQNLNEIHSESDGKTQEELTQIGWENVYAQEPGEFETFPDVYARVVGVIKELAKSLDEDSHVVCVSHGDVCMSAHVYARGLPGTMKGGYQKLKSQEFYPETASVTTLDVDTHGQVRSHAYTEAGTGEMTHAFKKAKCAGKAGTSSL
jgi:broad specificity phosphatase PhoE